MLATVMAFMAREPTIRHAEQTATVDEGRRHRRLSVRALRQPDVVSVPSAMSIADCARLMHDAHVGSLVVAKVHAGHAEPLGLLTDRDIVTEIVAFGLDATALTAGDLMTRPAATIGIDADLMAALAVMREKGVRRLVVTGRQGELAGVLAADDVVQALSEELDGLAALIRSSRERERQTRRTVASGGSAAP